MGRANETEIEIDEIISKALIDSGAMILMMSKGIVMSMGMKIQPLDHWFHRRYWGSRCSLFGLCRS